MKRALPSFQAGCNRHESKICDHNLGTINRKVLLAALPATVGVFMWPAIPMIRQEIAMTRQPQVPTQPLRPLTRD
jgi:hypothetical protein